MGGVAGAGGDRVGDFLLFDRGCAYRYIEEDGCLGYFIVVVDVVKKFLMVSRIEV